MAENDGTFRCKPCRQPLNETDANCWRCGSKDIEDLRPKGQTLDLSDLILADQAGTEEVLRQWASGTYTAGSWSTTSAAIHWDGAAIHWDGDFYGGGQWRTKWFHNGEWVYSDPSK